MKDFTIEQLKKDIKKINKEQSGEFSFEPLRIIIELVDEVKDFKMIEAVTIKKPKDKEVVEIAKNGKTLKAVNIQFIIKLKDYIEQRLDI